VDKSHGAFIFAAMTQVAIALPEDLQEFVDQSVQKGHFAGPSQLIATALYAFMDQTELESIKLSRLRRDIELGTSQIQNGESSEWNLEEFLAEMHSSGAAGK
jgi:Arc/MetJ-type ribon-helix-helix transcriptional regulator